jgi:hypothetical protein
MKFRHNQPPPPAHHATLCYATPHINRRDAELTNIAIYMTNRRRTIKLCFTVRPLPYEVRHRADCRLSPGDADCES